MEKEQVEKRSIGKEIGHLGRMAHRYFKHELGDYSIGHAQIRTLHLIIRHEGLSQNDLANHFDLDKSSVSSQLNILEKNGYIIREKDISDMRGRKIFITDKTREIRAKISEKFSSWSDILTKNISEEEQELLFRLLDKMKINATEAIREIRDNE